MAAVSWPAGSEHRTAGFERLPAVCVRNAAESEECAADCEGCSLWSLGWVVF